jgi:hypothetical protein
MPTMLAPSSQQPAADSGDQSGSISNQQLTQPARQQPATVISRSSQQPAAADTEASQDHSGARLRNKQQLQQSTAGPQSYCSRSTAVVNY